MTKVEASARWEADIRHLILELGQLSHDLNPVQLIHITPYLEQLNPRSLRRDDVLRTNRIRRICIPGEDFGYWNCSTRVYFTRRYSQLLT